MSEVEILKLKLEDVEERAEIYFQCYYLMLLEVLANTKDRYD